MDPFNEWWIDRRNAGFTRPRGKGAFKWKRMSFGRGWVDVIGALTVSMLCYRDEDNSKWWMVVAKFNDTELHRVVCANRRDAVVAARFSLAQAEQIKDATDRLRTAVQEVRNELDLP